MKETLRAVDVMDRQLHEIQKHLIPALQESRELINTLLLNPLPSAPAQAVLLQFAMDVTLLFSRYQGVDMILGQFRKMKEQQEISGESDS